MKKDKRTNRLTPWLRRTVYAAGGILLLSGATWLVLENFVRVEGAFGPERHPVEHWMIVVHGVSAYALLPLVGLIGGTHAVQAWAQRRNRMSGLILAGVLIFLAISALALYYVGADQARYWSSLSHWAVGVCAPLALVFHIWMGRNNALR